MAIPSWCRVGAKVVCVNGDYSRLAPRLRACAAVVPELGHEYTIRRVREITGKGTYLLLDEVRNPAVKYGRWDGEPQFAAKRFAPIARSKHHPVSETEAV